MTNHQSAAALYRNDLQSPKPIEARNRQTGHECRECGEPLFANERRYCASCDPNPPLRGRETDLR